MPAKPPSRDADLDRLAVLHGLDEAQVAALDGFVGLLLGWRRGNVTGLSGRSEIVEVLLGDSLALLDVPALREREGAGWLDLGAGAGIPGIPLAVALQGARVTLLDSVAGKCAFLDEAVAVAGLPGRARVVCSRSETFAAIGAPGREAHAVVLARAVASLPVLVELAAPLLAVGGVLLASKTRRALEEEGPAGAEAARRCGLAAGPPAALPKSPLADAVVAVYTKVEPSPERLPRRPGMAAKRPLSA
jgi:16S rRNA (guanine527-N7)-methyltransferase